MGSSYLNDAFFMKWADDVSQASTCSKIKVGAVLVKNKRVVSIGYNGSLSGQPHCHDHFVGSLSRESLGEEDFLSQHRVFSEQNEGHAEESALVFAWQEGINVSGATLYTQFSPCFGCSKLIIRAKISLVVYQNVYDEKAIKFLRSSGIKVIKLK